MAVVKPQHPMEPASRWKSILPRPPRWHPWRHSTVGGVAQRHPERGRQRGYRPIPGQGIGCQPGAIPPRTRSLTAYGPRPGRCRCWCLRTSTAPASSPGTLTARRPAADVQITAIANPHRRVIAASTKGRCRCLRMPAFKAMTNTTNKVVGYVTTTSGSSGELSVTDEDHR